MGLGSLVSDLWRALGSGCAGGLVLWTIQLFDAPVLGRELHWGWPLGVGFIAIFVVYAGSTLIWRSEE